MTTLRNSYFDALDPKFGGIIGRRKWSLCLGAGVSYDIVPTWQELARIVVNKSYNENYNSEHFKKIVGKFGIGLDGWFQSCLNHLVSLGNEESKFYDILRESIYSDLLTKSEEYNVRKLIAQGLHYPFNFSPTEIDSMYEFMNSEFKYSTNNVLAKILLDSFDTNKEPASIISFNADAILNFTVYLFDSKFHLDSKSDGDLKSFKRRRLKRIIQSIELNGTRKKNIDYIPLYHIHGCLFPKFEAEKQYLRKESINKLIFEESAYINLSASMYSWAQSTFLFHSQADDILFVGLSLTDPNLRKWLAWTHSNKLNELRTNEGKDINYLKHVWITTAPESESEKEIISKSVSHLGVRVAFINDYSEIEQAVRNVAGIN